MIKLQNDEIFGIFSKEIYFDPMFMAKLFDSNEYIIVRLIISKAKTTKSNQPRSSGAQIVVT